LVSSVSLKRDSCPHPRRKNSYTIPFSGNIAVRVYSDTNPHNWKIADLQKGLVLVFKKAETVGEGTGFGLPILVYSDETCFSGTSRIHVSMKDNHWLVVKEFVMDRIQRNSFRNIKLKNHRARTLVGHLSRLYQEHPLLRFLTLKKLAGNMQIGTSFLETKPVGCIAVTYRVGKKEIQVEADFQKIEKNGLKKIFMLNEQGFTFFRRYTDSIGTLLTDGGIGAWDEVLGEWASINSTRNVFGFRLWKKDEAVLRRGQEYIKDSLDWVGLDYEINPKKAKFDYKIEIVGL
jgi:hypothetical protein